MRPVEPAAGLPPVRDRPPAVKVLCTAILVFQVVRMFPNIADQKHRFLQSGHALVIGQRKNFEGVLSCIGDEKRPPGSELPGRSVSELVAEGLDRPVSG
jgi:hypothetical protein